MNRCCGPQEPTTVTAAGAPAELTVRAAGDHSVRVTLAPVGLEAIPPNPALVDRDYLEPVVRLGQIGEPVRQHTGEPVEEPTTLRVYRGADGTFTLYDDDGISQDYLRGHGSWTRITWDDDADRLTLEHGTPEGATETGEPRRFRIRVLPDGASGTLLYEGARVEATFE